jgi:two-component system invasion response regulator UvrY
MIRVLLVDDHHLVRTGIKRLLADEAGIEVVGEAASGKEALGLARQCEPEVILLDLIMPGMGGLEATRKLLRINKAFKIVIVSVHDAGPLPGCLLEAGALGYLTKGAPVEEMVHAIKQVHGGRRYISADAARAMALDQIDGRHSPVDDLSPRELEVMLLVSQGHNLQEISDRLCISPKTVSTLRSRVMRKLGTTTDVAITHLAYRHGLIPAQPVLE